MNASEETRHDESHEDDRDSLQGVAIVGMSGRFPGAKSVAEFWKNQLAGVESISQFRVEELEISNSDERVRQPNYIRARSVLNDIDLFDAEFFGILPKEAELMDPQHRLFLECCWEALEDAGYDSLSYPGAIGVIAGAAYGSYFHSQVCVQPGFTEDFLKSYQIGNYTAMMGNHPDYLATRVSYKLNLKGPSFAIQSACSTSLVAVCQACQSLLTYQSDMMLAGGVSITLPQKRGYLYQDGGMGSADGHCRPFDAEAQGTVFGSGVGVVLLKRLEDALADGDQIYSVIRGFATNNDGTSKVGYTAPSIEGQSNVVAMAQLAAGVEPETIGYVEAHGTATPLGDPIELAALQKAFRSSTDRKGFCTIGTAKANVGHLDVAAGVTGLIHATHVVRSAKFPPTLHFKTPTDKFDFADSPFRVTKALVDWARDGHPRRAGVSAFGVGGTNAHLVIEEPPLMSSEPATREAQLLILSARSPEALDAATRNLADFLKKSTDVELADVAHTLQVGRRAFDCRRTVAGESKAGAIIALDVALTKPAVKAGKRTNERGVCFMFPGQGSQYPNMGRDLYEKEAVFRLEVDRCAVLLQSETGLDLLSAMYPEPGSEGEAGERLKQTILAQPAIFTVEYALAKLWMSWGISPSCMIGHSIGEFTAACLAEVFSLEDGLRLIAARGRLMQGLSHGAMLSVRMAAAQVQPLLGRDLSVAAINAPSLCVVSGPDELVAALEAELTRRGEVHRRLHTSHAFHSVMMEPILEAFRREFKTVTLAAPKLPFVSTVTGTWIDREDATSPDYWTRHLRETVRFADGITEIQRREDLVLIEIGPGSVLKTLSRLNPAHSSSKVVVTSLIDDSSESNESLAMLQSLGTLWTAGVRPDWEKLHEGAKRHRISLPTYPFERKRFWLDVGHQDTVDPLIRPATNNMFAEVRQPASTAPFSDQKEIDPMPTTPARSRKENLKGLLVGVFEDLSGLDIAAEDSSVSFLELGCDSLFLTQVSQALQAKFGLKITFRQLLGEQSTLAALTDYVDEHLAAGLFEEETSPAEATSAQPVVGTAASPPAHALAPGDLPLPAAQGTLEQVMRDQLQALNQLFAQQLAVLKGQPAATRIPSPVVPAAQPIPVQPAATATKATTQKDAADELKGYTPFKPLQKSVSGDLTPKQEEHIRKLIQLYTSRTATSKSKTQQYRHYLADPRVVSGFRVQWKEMVYPIITSRSKGSRLWDLDGNEYIDILNGFGPIMLGHRPSYIEEAIEKQLREGFEIGPQTLLAGEVAEALCELTGNERATFCNTGSEAVIAAMRVARTVSGKSRVVFFAGDYHGMFDEVLVKGFKRGGNPQSMPLAPGIPRDSVANMTVLDYGSQDSLDWIRAHANELAAVLVEPVQSRHPNLQPVEFLKELRKITAAADVCLIFDEVVTGFRAHPGGCQALFDIRADLATYGKVLAGGMPIGVLAGKSRYMDALDGGTWQYGDDSFPETGVTFFAGTFVRHPLTMAACAAVLKHLKEEGPALQEGLTRRTTGLVARLNALFSENEVPTRIETFSSFFYFSFPGDFRFASLFYYHLRAKGIHLLEGFPCFLTTEHSDADLDRIVQSFAETIAEMQAGEVLPLPTKSTAAISSSSDAGRAVPGPNTEAPITESQMEILLSAQLSTEANCGFNESFTLHLNGTLNQTALKDALTALLQRHEALRATFDLGANKQHFSAPGPVTLPVVDLSHLDPVSQKDNFDALIVRDAHEPFDLRQGPLVRMALVRFTPERHALVFTSHHAVCDGWSINVLLNELSALYTAQVEGKTATLDPLMTFSEYARSQDLHFAGAEGAEIEKFWLEQFEVLPPLLDLPIDHPRPPMKSFNGATYRRKISLDTLKEIKRAGAQQKCTLFVTLLSGFTALLGRLTGQEDVVVGVPSAGQSLIEDKVLVGHCVNFVPMRGMPESGITLTKFMEQQRKTVFDAYDHQNYTFGRLVRKLSIPRDASRLPLLEAQFNLEKVGSNLSFAGLTSEVDPNPKSFVNFDIFINAVEGVDGVTFHVDYNTALIDARTIERWMDCYEQLLKGFSGNPSRTLGSLPILSERERELVQFAFNQTDAPYPGDRCVHQLFERQTRKTPKSIAIQFENEALTFEELNARTNRLARYLILSGIKPAEVVGVYMERSIDMVVALVAIWKVGAAYIPLDPTFPLERLKMVFEDIAEPVVLTQAALAKDLPVGPRVITVDDRWPVIDLQESGNLDLDYDPSRMAYVIYTSGSTGRPKGVEVTQSNVVNLLTSMANTPGLTANDVLVAVTTISFDIAALELYLPLITGAKLVLASRAIASDGTQLLQLLRSSKATVMQATPVTFRLLLVAGWKGEPRFTAWCGGEALPRDLADAILDCDIALWNMYGPTETTIWSAANQVRKDAGPVPVGPPISNTQFYVLDTNQQLVPTGVAGELYIGGEGVAQGYFKRPDLTLSRFIPDTFNAKVGARLYKTGDLVRRRMNGEFEFLGRTDGQIKLRGFRIELGEIETALATHPSVGQAVVSLREDIPGDKRLVAYLISENGHTPETSELRSYLLGKLPDYMAPAAFVYLRTLPLTANGKIDRRALPGPDWAPRLDGVSYVAPQTDQEQTFAKIWAGVLHLEKVGVKDNIFELGADSLHVFQIAARANQAGIEVKPRQILQHRTITAVLADLAVSEPALKSAPLIAVSRAKYRISQTQLGEHREPVNSGGTSKS